MADGSTVIKIVPGVSVPQDVYGIKSAGNAQLVALQPQCPAPYLVPDAWAVPPLAYGGFSTSDIRVAFDDLTKGLTQGAVLMARSSATDEKPGKNPTLFSYFDPKKVEASFKRYVASVNELLNTSTTMGVMLTKMVGDPMTLPDGRLVIGRKNVSFVADSHNPFVPDEMSLSLVHGLGTKVVEAGREFIVFTVDRKTNLITYVGEGTEEAILRSAGSNGVRDLEGYRQQSCEAFDVRSGKIESRAIAEDVFARQLGDAPNVVMGKLVEGVFPQPSSHRPGEMYRMMIYSPFGNGDMFTHLTGALKYLSNVMGPVQIEGAFPNSNAGAVYLYQAISVPEPTVSHVPLTIQKPDLVATQVIGYGHVQMPLYRLSSWNLIDIGFGDGPEFQKLREFDLRHSATGYAVLAREHDRYLTCMTPHCRVRLSQTVENPSSHPVTWTRFKMAEDPSAGYMLAMKVQEVKGGQVIKYGPHDMVTIESNGKEMRLELPPLPEERLITWVRERGPVVAHELKGAGVTLIASVMAQLADAMMHNDWQAVQQISPTSLAADGGAIFGVNLALAPVKFAGAYGLKLGVATAVLQILHTGKLDVGQTAVDVGSGVALGGVMTAMEKVKRLSSVAKFLKTTPGSFVLSTAFMLGMMQVNRAMVDRQMAPGKKQFHAAALELLQAEAQIRQAQREGHVVDSNTTSKVRTMMALLAERLMTVPDTDEVILRHAHEQAMDEIRDTAIAGYAAARACPDVVQARNAAEHTETVAYQREERKFFKRLNDLRAAQANEDCQLIPLDTATEFQMASDVDRDGVSLPGEQNITMDDPQYLARDLAALLATTPHGIAQQLKIYLHDHEEHAATQLADAKE